MKPSKKKEKKGDLKNSPAAVKKQEQKNENSSPVCYMNSDEIRKEWHEE